MRRTKAPLRRDGGWPVVSGVAPETVRELRLLFARTITSKLYLTTKFGATPNLTGVTPVPPALRVSKNRGAHAPSRVLADASSGSRAETVDELFGSVARTAKGFDARRVELHPGRVRSPMLAAFMRDEEPASTQRNQIPVPKGTVEVW